MRHSAASVHEIAEKGRKVSIGETIDYGEWLDGFAWGILVRDGRERCVIWTNGLQTFNMETREEECIVGDDCVVPLIRTDVPEFGEQTKSKTSIDQRGLLVGDSWYHRLLNWIEQKIAGH